MTALEKIPDEQLQPQHAPQSSPSTHQTPLCVLMTPDRSAGNLFTLPNATFLKGIRNSLSIERNACQIVTKQNIPDFIPKACAWVGDEESRAYGMAFLVERAYTQPYVLPDHKDLTNLDPSQPIPEHNSRLELHNHESLLARLEMMNRQHLDNESLPPRSAEEAFVRAYGHFILRSIVRSNPAI